MENRMKFGICNEMFKEWSFEKIIDYVVKIGYDGIEIAPFTLAQDVNEIPSARRAEIRSLAEENNLEIIGLHWLLASPKGLSVSSPDKKIRAKTSEYLKDLINFCADLDGRIMVFGSPKQRDISSSSNYGETYNYVRDGFLEILPLAEKRKVTIVLEPLTKKETNFVNTAGEAMKMIKEINHPNFRLHLDVKAMCGEEKSIPEIIESSKDYLAHFHANDPNLLGPGFGRVDYQPIKQSLRKIGYHHYLSVEVFDFSPGPKIIAEKSIEYLKKIF
ncbi:MAG: D-tagatose 3-epimerase [bacterium (Candidatus Ratteibacteria) CG01_land_8_20_14_3_00_40_19]|uniref:D-tagatose 3-epimerase n=1 Tax=bacterium (Candidatus Ratteibacteria) CG01_land_8_20_14_3_00_40_19 TaxID=2014290 RepID=A0A2M7E8T2_9BACT|nr:MAG: D-tagatose 3-epimerase [bacterium (Candidatus Ratteibacteria) CG01_land_8_20_14_3_00_40_19]